VRDGVLLRLIGKWLNAGDGTAKELGLKKYTTRTDHKKDRRRVDMGYHYPR